MTESELREMDAEVVAYDVKWKRPNEHEILECHGLTKDSLILRLRAAIRNYGRVELLSLTPRVTKDALALAVIQGKELE